MDSRVRGNSAGTGGGIYGTLGSVLDISRSRVSRNAALVGIGGGVFNNGTLDLARSSMIENTAKSAGGAMFNLDGTVVVDGLDDRREHRLERRRPPQHRRHDERRSAPR